MLFDQIKTNKRRTVLLLLIFFALVAAIGAAFGYLMMESATFGTFIALLLGLIYAVSLLFQSTEVVMSMNNAREVTAAEAPDLYHVVEDMALVAQIPMPRVFIINDPSLNAFATGPSPDKAAVAATTGLLAVMNREELEAVMAHEVSHIRNFDIRLATIAVALVSAITMLSSMGSRSLFYRSMTSRRSDSRDNSGADLLVLALSVLALFLAPLAATIVQLAISRQREFLADAGAVELTRNPYGMIRALEKLDQSGPMSQPVDPASAALYITAPKAIKTWGLDGLFRTHPPIAERIARLKAM